MTNAQVQQLIEQAHARGFRLHASEAIVFLGARELLAQQPSNANALMTVTTYTRYLETGTKPVDFSEFMLPRFFTDEEIAERARRNQ